MTLVDEFAAALTAVGGTTAYHPSRDAAVDAVCTLIGDAPALVDDDPELAEIARRLTLADDAWAAETGVTTALAAVADTGSLAMVSDAAHPRSTALLPPRHVALVPVARLVRHYADALDLLAAQHPIPSAMYLLTGPSSSGDIEMTTVRGVHGPAEVHVVLCDQ